ncbi:MAG: hypothetical protein RIQ54_453 [Candidatus Parcubacteria bacterium]|jgi:tRNA A37 threonylcarbamoyladenosine dehydratase
MVQSRHTHPYLPQRVAVSSVSVLSRFVRTHPGCRVVDEYRSQLEDLFLLRNPRYRFFKNYQDDFEEFVREHGGDRDDLILSGEWFYYPWLNSIVHVLPDSDYQEMRMGRNRNLIQHDEQRSYYDAIVAIDGMSVGSHVALTLAMTGGARHIKIADMDTISGSNLNRIRTGIPSVGVHKAVLVARSIYEINPYAMVEVYDRGITAENIEQFLLNPRVDVLVEEADNPWVKLRLREIARANRIPVVMAADNGDGIIADVERFDVTPSYPVLHGIMGNLTSSQLRDVAAPDLPKIIARMAGANIAHLRMIESVAQVGISIYSWPQLGTAATLCGSVLSYLVRNIVLKNSAMRSGRFEVNPDAIFLHGYSSVSQTEIRNRKRARLLKRLG